MNTIIYEYRDIQFDWTIHSCFFVENQYLFFYLYNFSFII